MIKINCEDCGVEIEARNTQRKFCDECKKIRKDSYMKKYNEENSEEIRRIKKEHYQKNKGKLNAKCRKYYQEHKEKILEQQKEYQKRWGFEYRRRPEVREHRKEYNKKYREKNREEKREYDKKYHQENRNKLLLQMSEYKKKNRIQMNEYKRKPEVKEKRNNHRRKREKEDKQYNIMHRLRSSLIRALNKYTQTGKIMTSKQYGISYQAIIEYLEPIPKDLFEYDIHHRKPLFTFNFVNPDGTTNLEEVRKAWEPENLMLVTKEEHREIHRELNHMEENEN